MSKGMTREQLADFVKETSGPLIKEQLGSELAQVVRDNVEKMASDPNGPWANKWSNHLVEPKASTPSREKGAAFGRVVRAMAVAKMNKMGSEGTVEVLRGWGDNDLADALSDARTKALAAGDATAGGFLVPTQFSNEVI